MNQQQFEEILACSRRLPSHDEEFTAICRIDSYEAYQFNGNVVELNRSVKWVDARSRIIQRIILRTESGNLYIDAPGSPRSRAIRTSYFIGQDEEYEYLFIRTSNGNVCMYKLSDKPNRFRV